MEFEFDKEIDSLLRQTAKGENLFALGTPKSEHIDADEISMFAENALPEKAKPRVMKHLADCDRCRTVLSNVIVLNSEAELAAIPATETKAETDVVSTEQSWFQKLFATRNLAFGMGALAIVFAVGIGFIVVQNLSNGQSDLAQKTLSSENNGVSDLATANKESDTQTHNDTNSNSVSGDTQNPAETELKEDSIAGSPEGSTKESSDGSADDFADKKELGRENRVTPADNDLAKNTPSRSKRDDAQPKKPNLGIATDSASAGIINEESDSDDKAERLKDNEDEGRSRSEVEMKPKSAPPPPPIVTRQGKRRAKKVEEKTTVAGSTTNSTRTTIGDKTFNRKNAVWTDSAYKGQRTTTVKRDTTQYRNLDAGLQSIGNQLDGTVLVVWKSKAYKIQ